MPTPFTELVGCRLPLQQAGMGSVAGPELAAAVTAAGALGMLGVPANAEALGASLDAVHALTDGPVGVNFLMPFLDRTVLEAAASSVPLVEFFYGDPDPGLVTMVHAGGARAVWQVGSRLEAQRAADAGCDVVVAQGVEAGGHVRGTVALDRLLDEVLAAVTLPVIAAGGIGTAADVAAVLRSGAAAARVGTRFVAAAEADAHRGYQEALVDARAADTVLTTTFSVFWPDAPHRVLASSIEAALATEGDTVGQSETAEGRMPVPRLSPIPPARTTTGRIEAMALYAGESVSAVLRVQPAGEIVAELAAEIDELFIG